MNRDLFRALVDKWQQDDRLLIGVPVLRMASEAAEIADNIPASADALDDICILLDAPNWEYPGQVVRDVAIAIGMSVEEMAQKLKSAKERQAS